MDDLQSEKEQIEEIRAWWAEYGRYVIADPCFGLWIQAQEDLGGVPPPTLIGTESERRVTAELLAFTGIEVSVAENGKAACDMLTAPGARPSWTGAASASPPPVSMPRPIL